MYLLTLRSVKLESNRIVLASWAEFFIVLSIFSKELFSRRFLGVDFDFLAYSFAILYFFANINLVFSQRVIYWKLFAYVLISSMISIIALDLQYFGFLKQAIPILIIYCVNSIILTHSGYQSIFRLYVKFAFYSAIFGIFQILLKETTGIYLLLGPHGRLDSIAYEPSHYAAILLPALVYVFYNLKEYKKEFITMLIALVLTYNLTAYLTFLLIISISYLNFLYLIIAAPLLYYIVFGYLSEFNENFSTRINDTLNVFKGDVNVLNSTLDANGTTVSMYSNLNVAIDNLRKWNVVGSGLGGNEETYYRLYENTMFRYNYYYGLNAPAGHSLTIRIFSEFGIIGLILYMVAIIKRIINLTGIHKIIAYGCFAHFLSKSFKLGAYIDYGTPFFLTILFINYIDSKSKT